MQKIVLTAFLVFGLFAFTENIFGQGFYKWVDGKGTVHYSDTPPSSISDQEKERPKENGIEVLKRLERVKRSKTTAYSEENKIIIDYSQGSSGGSSGRSTTIVRSGRS
jgi:hypothetical protein